MPPEVTIISVVRHGHGTAAMHVEGLYDSSDVPFDLIYADIASPPPVRHYLAECARRRDSFTLLRFDDLVSRQTARSAALERVETPFVVLVDNNVLCNRGWLSRLLGAARTGQATLVSPTIVFQGGSVHYSGGRILRKRSLRSLGRALSYRPQDVGAPAGSKLSGLALAPMEVDFVESHCCLATTEALRLPGVLEPAMHNTHTMCYASYKLKRDYGRRHRLEPSAIASIVPIGFGYDLPWMLLEYARPDRIVQSYRQLRALLGAGPSIDPSDCLHWYARHLRHLMIQMLESGRLASAELLAPADVPETVTSYNEMLPGTVDRRLRAEVVPFLQERHPECVEPARRWLDFRRPRLRGRLRRIAGALLDRSGS